MRGESRYCCLTESVGSEVIRREPFPHLVIRNALPPAVTWSCIGSAPGRGPGTAGARVDRASVELAAEIPCAPNTLVMWLNSPVAIHGVSPRAVTPIPRRYINLLGECYRRGISFTAPAYPRSRFRHWARRRKTFGGRPTPQATPR